MVEKFLAGVRVLDLSQFLPGPFATQMLGDLGADVIKVEPPGGDPMRMLDPFSNARVKSVYHPLVNAGKSVIELNLKSEEGRSALTKLVKHADVLLESYRPGVLDRLDLGPEFLRQLNPSLVHCALSGFGQTGPNRVRSGHDINYVAAAGQLFLTGTPERPVMAFPMIADYSGALQSVISVLGALVGRGKTGEGAYIDIAMADCVMAWQSQTLTAVAGGQSLMRGANLLTGGAACYGVYQTADGKFISLGAIETVFWGNFCDAVDRPDWIERQLEDLPQRSLIADVAELFSSQPRAYWDEKLGKVDCCYYPLIEPSELHDSAQVTARKLTSPEPGRDGDEISVLYPAWVDGKPPSGRPAVEFIDILTAYERWS